MDRLPVSQLLQSIDEFLVPLRTGKGFSREQYERLCASLREFSIACSDSDMIPKEVASAFVDLLSIVETSQALYQGDVQRLIRQATGSLFDLVQNACSTPQ